MIRRLKLLLIAVSAIGLGLLLWRMRPAQPLPPQPFPLTIERVQSLGLLMTTRLTVRSNASAVARGYLGDLTVHWSGDGEVLLGTDLTQAKLVGRDEAAHQAVIGLPEPAVLSVRLNTENGRERTEFGGLWQAAPDLRLQDAVDQSVRTLAEKQLRAAVTPQHRRSAEHAAEDAVHQLGRTLGWDLQIQWQK